MGALAQTLGAAVVLALENKSFWTLFKAGDPIFTNQGGQDRIEKVQGSDFTPAPRGLTFEIVGYQVDCDGKRFGY